MHFIMHYELSPAAEGFFSVEHDKAVLCKKSGYCAESSNAKTWKVQQRSAIMQCNNAIEH